MKKAHKCRYCKKHTNYFIKIKKKVYNVKWWECEPLCMDGQTVEFLVRDRKRVINNILRTLNEPSPLLGLTK